MKYNSPSFFQHLIWMPVRIFMYWCCHVKIEGVEHVKNMQGNVIFASNHITEIDPLMVVACLPFFSNKLPIIYATRAKKTYRETLKNWRKYIYGGKFFEIIGGYEVYPGSNDYNKALRNHLEAIASRRSVCIFPVGRLHSVKEIDEARGGISYLAKETGLPIIPIHIKGVDRGIRPIDYIRRKPRLRVTFGQPIYAKDIFDRPIEKIDKSDRKKFENASIELMRKIVQL